MLKSQVLLLVTCISGIYTSFLLWSYLQEQISIQQFGELGHFHAPFFINLIQCGFATIVGYLYSSYSDAAQKKEGFSVLNLSILKSLALISLTQSLSSPIGLSSIEHVDYLLYQLAKSCKLIPVMVVHIVLYRETFPLYKYFVAFIVTSGVVLFTLFNGSKKSSNEEYSNLPLGLLYLAGSLLLDGLTNAAQDSLFRANKELKGAHLMYGLNFVSFFLTLFYCCVLTNQFIYAIKFIGAYPVILKEILLYSICGAIGQIFIFVTLANFGSLILITVTVTRKMISMLLSVFLFGHDLSSGQWAAIGLVFGGIAFEAYYKLQLNNKAEKKKTN